MVRSITTGLFLLATLIVTGQDVSPLQDDDKKAFVAIFWDVKEFPTDDDSIFVDILREAGISNVRYAKIVSSGLNGETIKLSDTEEAALGQIQSLNERHKQETRAFEKGVCAQHGLTPEHYNVILHAYRSDIAFQQSMRPYFKTYFEEQ